MPDFDDESASVCSSSAPEDEDADAMSVEEGQIVTVGEAGVHDRIDEMENFVLMNDVTTYALERDLEGKTWFLRHRVTLSRVDLKVPAMVPLQLGEQDGAATVPLFTREMATNFRLTGSEYCANYFDIHAFLSQDKSIWMGTCEGDLEPIGQKAARHVRGELSVKMGAAGTLAKINCCITDLALRGTTLWIDMQDICSVCKFQCRKASKPWKWANHGLGRRAQSFKQDGWPQQIRQSRPFGMIDLTGVRFNHVHMLGAPGFIKLIMRLAFAGQSKGGSMNDNDVVRAQELVDALIFRCRPPFVLSLFIDPNTSWSDEGHMDGERPWNLKVGHDRGTQS